MRLFVTLALGLVLWSAGSASAQSALPASVEAALARGDSSRAYEAVREALTRDAANPALHRARLTLELDGYGTGRLPRVVRQQQYVDTARALLRLAPTDTLALRILVADALWTVLSMHDRVTPTATRSPISGAEFVSRQEVAARMGGSRFDMDARRALADDLDASGPARKARRDVAGWLATWRAAAPTDPRAYTSAVALAALDGAWDEALEAAQVLRAARPDLPDGALFAGLARYRLGDAEAATADFEHALGALGPDQRAPYENLAPLLTPAQQDAYAADLTGVAAEFWATTDPRRLTAVNERRAEHLARVVEANLLFGTTLENRFARTPEDTRGADSEQGRIWVRYGRPDRTTRFSPNANGVEAYGDGRFAVWDYADFRFVFDDPDADGRYRTYSPSAAAMSRSSRAADDDFVMQDRRMQREDPQRTQVGSDPPLDVPVLVSRFRTDSGGTRVVVGYGVPLAAPPAGPSVPLAVQSGVFVLDGGRLAAHERRTYAALPAGRVLTAQDATVWADAVSVPLAGGAVRVEVETAGGARWGAAEVALDPLPAAGFGLSDLLLATAAEEDGTGPILVGDLHVWPAPWGVFAVSDPIPVVVEIYGLALRGRQTDYAVEAALTPSDRRRRLARLFGRRRGAGVAVAVDAQGDRATESTLAVLDASGQAPGRYTLTFAVTDRATGQTATATREIVLE